MVKKKQTSIEEFIKQNHTNLNDISKLSRTESKIISANQYLSFSFGQAISNKKTYFLVPEDFFEVFRNANGLYAEYIADQPSVYFNFNITNEKKTIVTLKLRIFVRKKRVQALSLFDEIHIAPYCHETNDFDKNKAFAIKIKKQIN